MSRHRRRRPVPSHRRGGGAFDLGRAAARFVLACLGGLMVATLLPFAVGGAATVVVSGSMTPAIRPGDVALTVPVSASAVAPGHVIMFDSPAQRGTTVIHRVVSGNEAGAFVTRGDANAAADSTPVPASAVRGRVVARVPYLGLPKFWLQTGQWSPMVATCVLLTLLVSACVDGRTPRGRGRRIDPRTTGLGGGAAHNGGAGAQPLDDACRT